MEEVDKVNEEYFKMKKSELYSAKEKLNCYINGVRVKSQTTTEWDKHEVINEESKEIRK